MFHVFFAPNAQCVLDGTQYAVCVVCISSNRIALGNWLLGLEPVVPVVVHSGIAPRGRLLSAACSVDWGNSSGWICRYLRRVGQPRFDREKAGDSERPASGCLCGNSTVLLFCCKLGTVECASQAGSQDIACHHIGILSFSQSVRFGGCEISHCKKHGSGTYFCNDSGQGACCPVLAMFFRCFVPWVVFVRLAGSCHGLDRTCGIFLLSSHGSLSIGGISGDLAGWFLQTAELAMLAALTAVQFLEAAI